MGFWTPKYPAGAEPPAKPGKSKTNIHGIKLGPPDPKGWTAEDREKWTAGSTPYICEKRTCKDEASEGNSFCDKHMNGKGFS